MSHKYRVDTVTRYNRSIYSDHEARRSCYYASSIKEIVDGLECFGNYEKHSPTLYTEYLGYGTRDHFVTRLY